MPHRYSVLDSYRFLAAIGIVAYHFEGHFSVFLPHPRDVLEGFQTLVDFFFVLSGFVLMHTYGDGIVGFADYGDFLRKRFARIYPLHVATLGLCMILFFAVKVAAIPVRDPSIIDMGLLVPNLLLVQAWGMSDHAGLNIPSWSISAEAFVYILFPLLAGLVARSKPIAMIGIAVLMAACIETARRALGLPAGSLATFDFGNLRAVPMFFAGIVTYKIVASAPVRPLSWAAPHALLATIVALMLWKAPLYLIDALYPPLVALLALAERGGRHTLLARPLFIRLGHASFAIYMVHTFVQIACVSLVRHLGWTNPFALLGVAGAGTIVTILIGLASFAWFETPMRRWLAGSSRLDRGGPRSKRLREAALRSVNLGAPN